ncbi:MAG: IS66 family transposase [Solirubrobacterales bacterium]|nr:IS66 family transposase [Solirubrobacterales bacterium]
MRQDEIEAIALAGGDPARRLVIELLEQVAKLPVLLERIEELERRVDRDSGNSSQPPSSDAPKSRAERRLLAREAYKRSMRKSGGQPGHEGKTRELVAPDRVDERLVHLPERCGCGHRFDGSEEEIGDPVCHQQYELPVIRALVIEHSRVRLGCPGCGRPSLAELPGPALAGFGPRLDAHIAMLAGVLRLSREDVRRVVVEVFGVPASTGAIGNAIMRMSRVMADPWVELRHAVQQAEVIHADETTWRLRGAQQWLWVAASSLAACYRIDPSRSQAAAKALLGEDFGGFVVSDRYAGYHFLDVLQQQLCWCHVIRQLVEVSQRSGAAGRRGKKLVALARQVIGAHRAYLEEDHDTQWLAIKLAPLRAQIRELLEQCAAGRHARTANFAAGLLDEYEALWTFADVPQAGLDLTNNAAERAVRHAVLMRKIQGGTQSEQGSRWIERIQSVRETCRLHKRPVLDWLTQAATAAHQGQPAPTLLPAAAQGP